MKHACHFQILTFSFLRKCGLNDVKTESVFCSPPPFVAICRKNSKIRRQKNPSIEMDGGEVCKTLTTIHTWNGPKSKKRTRSEKMRNVQGKNECKLIQNSPKMKKKISKRFDEINLLLQFKKNKKMEKSTKIYNFPRIL